MYQLIRSRCVYLLFVYMTDKCIKLLEHLKKTRVSIKIFLVEYTICPTEVKNDLYTYIRAINLYQNYIN